MPAIPLPFSEKSVSDWITLLQQADAAEERLRALQAVGLLGSEMEASRWANYSLRDVDSTVRALAAKLLGGNAIRPTDEAEQQLIQLLGDDDPDVQFEAARSLIRQKSIKRDQVVPVLVAFLDELETHALMIAAVINALVEIDLSEEIAQTELLPRLERFFDHERAEVREAVSMAFAKWPKLSKSCIDRLLPLLDDSEPIVREKIAYTIGRAGTVSDAVLESLQIASRDEDTEVAREASEALKRLASSSQSEQ